MNSVNLIGRLTKDPEIKRTDDGNTICDFTLAVDDAHAKDDRADYFGVTVFGTAGELCERYLRKGFLAGVSGRLRSERQTEGLVRNPVKIIGDHVRFLQWPEKRYDEARADR
jgi:single-strand DNA-binding protein